MQIPVWMRVSPSVLWSRRVRRMASGTDIRGCSHSCFFPRGTCSDAPESINNNDNALPGREPRPRHVLFPGKWFDGECRPGRTIEWTTSSRDGLMTGRCSYDRPILSRTKPKSESKAEKRSHHILIPYSLSLLEGGPAVVVLQCFVDKWMEFQRNSHVSPPSRSMTDTTRPSFRQVTCDSRIYHGAAHQTIEYDTDCKVIAYQRRFHYRSARTFTREWCMVKGSLSPPRLNTIPQYVHL